MDIREVLREYDSMFARNTPDEIAGFLAEQTGAARQEGDQAALLTLLNEQIGFARDRGRKDEAAAGCLELRKLIEEMGLAGTIHYGKSLLNIANAYRAFGQHEEAEDLFKEIEELYVSILPEGSYDYAPLYNNWSLLAMSRDDNGRAADLIRLAVDVVDRYDAAVIEQATSRVNLACALMGSAEDGGIVNERRLSEAESLLDEAVSRFESAGGRDYHYASALAARGDLQMRSGEYERAADNYARALDIVRAYTGSSSRTRTLESKTAAARAAAEKSCER